jgi:hypothetical protein
MVKTILVRADDVTFQKIVAGAAQSVGYASEAFPAGQDITDALVARQPWLVVVDLTQPDWQRFVISAKTSPATRKMPILAIAPFADAALMEQARKAGCDAVVTREAFMTDAAGMIQTHARLDESEQLLRQAQEPLPEMAHRAIEQFNAGEYFEQHETFEHLWRAEPGPVRQMYQGILQVGVAYYQIQRRNYAGARKLFQRAWQYLSVLPDVCQGVDIAQLRLDARAAQAELERLGPERIAEFPIELMKPLRYATSGTPR